MKPYQIAELKKELAKTKRILTNIKEMIDSHEGPAWSKNDLIKEYNKHVRIAGMIETNLGGAI